MTMAYRKFGGARNKYGAKKSNGYDSKKEHRRANELKLMQSAGLISDLREQVPYELIPAQYGKGISPRTGEPKNRMCLERSCRYVADFVYRDNETGDVVVEDVKGMRTKEYVIKRKLMLFRHGIKIKEI